MRLTGGLVGDLEKRRRLRPPRGWAAPRNQAFQMEQLLYSNYVPERSFIYLTVSSWVLISFVQGGKAVMLLNRTGGAVWALKSPSDPLRGQVGGVGPWKSRDFCAPNGTRLSAQKVPFHMAQKHSISRAQPPPTCPRNGSARIKNITHGAV